MAFRNGVLIQVGTIAVPVNVNSAVEKEDSALKTVCRGGVDATTGAVVPHPPSPIRNNPTCQTCGNTDYSTFEKAKVVGKDEYVIVDQTELATTKETVIGATKQIVQLSVHQRSDVNTQTIQGQESTYFLTPAKPQLMPLYSLLVAAVQRHPELTFMGQWTPTSKVGLYEFKAFGDTLVMEPRVRPEAIKVEQQAVVQLDPSQAAMVDTLITGSVTPFDPATYENTYAVSLAALVASKQAETGVAVASTPRSGGTATAAVAIDLTSLLEAAVKEAAA